MKHDSNESPISLSNESHQKQQQDFTFSIIF